MNATIYAIPGITGIENIKINDFDTDVKRVIETVCNRVNISVDQVYSRSRKGDVPICRYLSWYILRKKHEKCTLQFLAKIFGDYDHSTVHVGISLIQSLKSNRKYRDMITDMERTFLSNKLDKVFLSSRMG